jgi:hypothetical protein
MMPHRNPIIAHHATTIDTSERRRIRTLAEKLLANEPTLGAFGAFGGTVATGLGDFPNLVIEDHSAISLIEIAGDQSYSYRGLLLAGAGDMVVIEGPRSPDFETYCRDRLGLGGATIVPLPDAGRPRSVTARAADDPDTVTSIAALARRAGGLNLVPYMGIGHAWRLAGRVATAASVPVRVAAPPPRLTQRANDKLWFAEQVRDLLGGATEPRSFAAFGPAALAALVRNLSARGASVVVKVPDSASSAGNIVLDQRQANRERLTDLRDRLMAMLAASGWRGAYPLMVAAWERPVMASPSVQIWIPDQRDGDPIVEGIFDQSILGRQSTFSGATPSALSDLMSQHIVEGAARLSLLLQTLGYFGRCSFDAILVGDTELDAKLHWIECNGRWGGVSIPLTLANRLVGDWTRRPFVVVERRDLALRPRPLGDWLKRLSAHLFDVRQSGSVGAVILSPGRMENGSGYEIMVIGNTIADANQRAEIVVPLLTGPDD